MRITKQTPLDEAWRIAMQREKTAYEFYRRAASVVTDESLKKLFEFLMNEEKKHFQLLEEDFSRAFIKEM